MKKILVILSFLIISCLPILAQSGMKFAELAQRLDPYFDQELILDLKNQLPQGTDYTIWGWDVGDFSGDGHSDVALSCRVMGDKKRLIQVFLFVDIDGFLKKVGQYEYQFLELPLEIGVAIRSNTCYVTKKNKQFDWVITGYTFDNGCIMKNDIYTTYRIGDYTYEKNRNFVSLKGSEKYLQTRNGKTEFYRDFLIIPSYQRGRLLYKGYQQSVFADYVDYCFDGAFWWKGTADASFTTSSAYDEDYLYFTIEANDDVVVSQYCDTCIGDYFDIWFDINKYKNPNERFLKWKGTKPAYNNVADSGIFKITVYPGDFKEKPADVKVSTNSELGNTAKIESKNLKAISNLTDKGYIVKFKIPFTLFGYNSNPLATIDQFEIGCSVVMNDYDNEFRPEEKTELSTSALQPLNPSTYGCLILIANDEWYGESENIFIEDILKNLLEYGY